MNGHLDLWSREHYKAVDVDEPVATLNGWKRHGDIEPGDRVFGADGRPVRVVARTQVFADADCYRVTFCDGYSVVVSGEHLWAVDLPDKSRIGGSNERKKWKSVTINTREMKRHVDLAISVPSRRYPVVPVAQALQRPCMELPLDPYVLGAWLGNGSTGVATITSGLHDADAMTTNLSSSGVLVRNRKHSNAVAHRVGTGRHGKPGSSDVINALRLLGVFHDKHIPDLYQMASEPQRWALLQGLMDTDGSCAKSCGQAIYSCANERLAEGVFDLAQSLGLKATIAARNSVYNGKPYRYWQIQFLGRAERPPFRLPRKAAQCSTAGRRPIRQVKGVERVESRPVSCIQVERDDGIYLVGRNLVPTHNSTILTFAGSLFRIIRSHGDDPVESREVTIGIFSHTKPIAKGFLRQIKYELETNEHLQLVFDDIFFANPRKESSKWTEDEGITVKRKSNPKEATVEAHGLVDGQPTSKHFLHRQYDDVVTLESVTTPDMIAKTTSAYEMSDNLGTEGGTFGVVGTRYHFADTYGDLIKRGMPTRIYPCTRDGTENFTPGNCVLMKPETLRAKRISQGPYTFGTQMLLNPKGDNAQTFKTEWIRKTVHAPTAEGMNVYVLCDPANEKRRSSDYTTFWVIGLGPDLKYVALDVVRDRLNLTERTRVLFDLHRQWKPKGVGYEKYGMQADIEHIREQQEAKNYRFDIIELGGQVPKLDRIRKLIPLFEAGKIYLRGSKSYTDYEGTTRNLIEVFIEEEYKAFPVMSHDDMLDCLARIVDPDLHAEFPKEGLPLHMMAQQVQVSRPQMRRYR